MRFGPFGGILTLKWAHERGKGPLEVAEGLLGTPWVGPFRHLPTAGVCDLRLGASLRHLLSAGVSDQHISWFLACRLVPSSLVGSQHVGWFPACRLVPQTFV